MLLWQYENHYYYHNDYNYNNSNDYNNTRRRYGCWRYRAGRRAELFRISEYGRLYSSA